MAKYGIRWSFEHVYIIDQFHLKKTLLLSFLLKAMKHDRSEIYRGRPGAVPV